MEKKTKNGRHDTTDEDDERKRNHSDLKKKISRRIHLAVIVSEIALFKSDRRETNSSSATCRTNSTPGFESQALKQIG